MQNRIIAQNSLKDLLFANPFVGLGICGDEANVGEMSHNLYYSIWSTYGLLGGTLIILSIIYWCFKSLKRAKGLQHQILVMYMCMVFPRSFTGGDIWVSDVFWILLGICFMVLRSRPKSSIVRCSNNIISKLN